MSDLHTAMEKLLLRPGICAEARALIELAMEAQETGTMPERFRDESENAKDAQTQMMNARREWRIE